MEALERTSTLAIKTEQTTLSGTAGASGTTLTMSTAQTLKAGDVVGNFTKGFRSVVSVTSSTVYVVDEAYDGTVTAETFVAQSYGTNPTVAAADVIDFEKGIEVPTYKPDMKDRNVVRNTKSQMSKVRGAELNAAGNVSMELKGSGTATTPPESDPLWLSAVGTRRASAASATHAATACTTTSIVLVAGNGANHRKNESIAITLAGNVEVAWITGISTDTLTVAPAFSVAPGLGVTVNAGTHYKPSKREHFSFWETYWRGNITKCQASGNKVDKLNLDFKMGEIIVPKFSHVAKKTETEIAEAYTLGTPSYDATNPLMARNMTVKLGATAYDLSDLSFEISNETYKRQSLSTNGLMSISATGRKVSGSFNLLYEDTTFETAFRADTTADLSFFAGSVLGNIFAGRLQKIRYVEVSVSVDNGVFQHANKFEAEYVDGEDEAHFSFL